MNIFFNSSWFYRRSGMALLTVVFVLCLVTLLVLGFFTQTTGEKQRSRLTSDLVKVQLLEESVLGIVSGQVRKATTRGMDVGWTSQPGMIRTFGSENIHYKLYSAWNMEEVQADLPFDPLQDVPSSWSNQKGVYVDLNQPSADLSGEQRFPIFDLSATAEGLRVVDAPFSDINPTPMPVQWLYILQDGSLVGAQFATESGEVDLLSGDRKPSKDNPVVGRIAFWTDDETCKININTAAGDEWLLEEGEPGTYWDVPRTNTSFDRQRLANFQPLPREFQRYPGHPATTNLSAVFPWLNREDIGAIAPRITSGGSLGGNSTGEEGLQGDTNRLYASVDELLFNSQRHPQSALSAVDVQRNEFVLSAHSRAPELNGFGLPRIAMWPLHRGEGNMNRTVYDRMIAHCSSTNGAPYFFTRADAADSFSDFTNSSRNQQLYAFLQEMSAKVMPGMDGSILGKYGSDRDQILTQMVDYIRSANLADGHLPGRKFAGALTSAGKTSPGHGQVAPLRVGDTMGFGRFYTLSEIGLQFICTADGRVSMSNQTVNRPALGSFKNHSLESQLTSTERRIEALVLMELFSPAMGWTRLHPDMQIRIQGLDQFKLNGVSIGFPQDAVLVQKTAADEVCHGHAIGGAGGFHFLLKDRKLPARGTMPGDGGLTAENVYPFVSVPVTVNASAGTMQFTGGEIKVSFYAGSSGELGESRKVQTIQMRFPDGAFPIPELVSTGTPAQDDDQGNQVSPATGFANWWTFSADGLVRLPNKQPPAGMMGRLHFADRAVSNGALMVNEFIFRAGSMLRSPDVVRTLVPWHGDYRHIAAQAQVGLDQFVPHRYYGRSDKNFAHSLGTSAGQHYVFATDREGRLLPGAVQRASVVPDVPKGVAETGLIVDWDTGIADEADGSYINKPDDGNSYRGAGDQTPYFNPRADEEGKILHAPNRQISSPVMFGSLPSGIKGGTPWRTLLFRPNAVGQHHGAMYPPDHLWLDLFWMPVVEPYAISEPFSTAGKINLNHQIIPFTYIERSTALRALLHSERVIAIPTAASVAYKGSGAVAENYRHRIDADQTLSQWQKRFSQGRIFRTASEICEMHLVPEGWLLSNMTGESAPDSMFRSTTGQGEKNFWESHALTGDNCRERPYAGLYSRLTTRSNTFTVHYWVQVLEQRKRIRGDEQEAWGMWNEMQDGIVAERRGSIKIERYVDASDARLRDYAETTVPTSENLENLYRFRVLSRKKINP